MKTRLLGCAIRSLGINRDLYLPEVAIGIAAEDD